LNYIYADLGQRRRGDVVEVTLSGTEANVALLNSSNYSAFKSGRNWRGVGGLVKRSPAHLTVPSSGHWYGVAYITPGRRGSTRAGFRVLPSALPPLRSSSPSPLSAIRQAADDYAESIGIDPETKEWDVFISHASEDKAAVVRPLAKALRERGLTVWFDESELHIGDSLRRKIDQGIRACRFGVVVFSPAFFSKDWPNYELDGLVTMGMTKGGSIILPVWHEVTQSEVAGYSPSLAGLLARSTANVSIDALADEIAGVVLPSDDDEEVA
jgi:hypothetical protein